MVSSLTLTILLLLQPKDWYQAEVNKKPVWLYGWCDKEGKIHHQYAENVHVYNGNVLRPTLPTISAIDSLGLAKIQMVRPDLIWDERLQKVADEHAIEIAKRGSFTHFGFDGFPLLVLRIQAYGYPVQNLDDACDLGSSSSDPAGLIYIDRQNYHQAALAKYGNLWSGQTHFEALRDPKYRRVGFSTKGGLSTVILAK